MDNYRSNMRILELFAGTGSVGDVCRRLGHEVISLDRDLHADIEIDIMDWDYRINRNTLISFGLLRLARNTAKRKRKE